jgi:hypothetical protein
MSNQLAIAAVTRTLRNLLNGVITSYDGLPDDSRPTGEIRVTTLPLDRVRDGNGSSAGNQVNLFLYHAELNAAWRNRDIPRQVRPGENGRPPLALNLYYIVTAYGQDDSELVAHVLLGTAMSILHDHAVLSRAEIRDALALSELDTQIDQVKITPQPVTLDEISKLWTGFQSEYRLSAAYQVSVVLIESTQAKRTPLPVLRRGSEDRGPQAVASPAPALNGVTQFLDPDLDDPVLSRKPSAELGDTLVLSGTNLGGSGLTARFHNIRLEEPIERSPLPGNTETEIRVTLPGTAEEAEVPSIWPIGIYTVSLVVQRPNLPAWTTNGVPFALAPAIQSINPTSAAVGDLPLGLEVTCIPQVRANQRTVLLFGDREIPLESNQTAADPTAPSTLVFSVADAPAGEYVLRLRVDGVDSIPIDFSATPPQFDNNQKVTISP